MQTVSLKLNVADVGEEKAELMIAKTLEFIKENHLNIYDIATMTERDIEHTYCQPCNACNASYSVTKLFIVTMMGILYDKGLIGLDDRITDILSGDLNTAER